MRGCSSLRRGGSAKGSILASEVGLTTLEVVRGALGATTEEMKSIVMRASFSPLLTLSGDLSCAVLDGKGQVVAQGNDIPVHLGAMPFTAQGILSKIPAEDIAPGDVLITNDPYVGGTHLSDVTVMSPVFEPSSLARRRGRIGRQLEGDGWGDQGRPADPPGQTRRGKRARR
jgi:hypothetical protein